MLVVLSNLILFVVEMLNIAREYQRNSLSIYYNKQLYLHCFIINEGINGDCCSSIVCGIGFAAESCSSINV